MKVMTKRIKKITKKHKKQVHFLMQKNFTKKGK